MRTRSSPNSGEREPRRASSFTPPYRRRLPIPSPAQPARSSAYSQSAFATGDLNSDGIADFVAAGNGYVSVLLGLDTGLLPPAIFAGVADPTAVLIADFNGDGWNDVAVAGRRDR